MSLLRNCLTSDSANFGARQCPAYPQKKAKTEMISAKATLLKQDSSRTPEKVGNRGEGGGVDHEGGGDAHWSRRERARGVEGY